MGPPGSGKGTQASLLADRLGVTGASSGELFREHDRKDTELGRLARSFMERGAYVPDDVTIRMMMEWIEAPEQAKGFVLDGFPRTLSQAEALDKALESKGGVDFVLYVDVPERELIRRLSGRLICRVCQAPYHLAFSPPTQAGKCDRCEGELYQREDDRPEVVKRRIEVYLEETAPLIEYYRRVGKLREVNGEGAIEEIGQALVTVVC